MKNPHMAWKKRREAAFDRSGDGSAAPFRPHLLGQAKCLGDWCRVRVPFCYAVAACCYLKIVVWNEVCFWKPRKRLRRLWWIELRIFESPPFFSVTVGTWRSLPGDLTIAWFGDFPLHHFCWKHLWWQSCGALPWKMVKQNHQIPSNFFNFWPWAA